MEPSSARSGSLPNVGLRKTMRSLEHRHKSTLTTSARSQREPPQTQRDTAPTTNSTPMRQTRPRDTPGQHWGQTSPTLMPSTHEGTTVTDNTKLVRKQQRAQRTRMKVVCRRRTASSSQHASRKAGVAPPSNCDRLRRVVPTSRQAALGLLFMDHKQRLVDSAVRRPTSCYFSCLMNLPTETSWPCVSQTTSAGPSDLMATLAARVSEEPLLFL